MGKNNLLTIGEFSSLTGIKQSTLRYYDEVKLFQPIERGDNNYRYYSAPQTTAVNLINVMSSLNIPGKKISEIQKNRTPELTLELLLKQEIELNLELSRLQRAYAIIHTYCKMIREGLLADEQAVGIQWADAMPIELGLENDFSSGHFYDSFFKFMGQMANCNVDAAYPVGGFYEDMDALLSKPGQPTRFFAITPTGRNSKDSGEYLVGYTRGYYGNLGDLPQRMQAYAEEYGFTFIGPVYEIYLHNEISVAEPDQYLIQASALVKKGRS